MDFKKVASLVNNKLEHFYKLVQQGKGVLLQSTNTKEELWSMYYDSIPLEHNPIYRTQREFDCRADRHFVQTMGGVVFVSNTFEKDTIWNVEFEEETFFKDVFTHCHQTILSKPIEDFFTREHRFSEVGKETSLDYHDFSTWYCLYTYVPKLFDFQSGAMLERVNLFKRALDTLKIEHVELILDLCKENDIYRGTQYVEPLSNFLTYMKAYESLPASTKEMYAFLTGFRLQDPAVYGIRNTSIGSLLVDLAEGKDLENAVRSFEVKVAPQNYKRSSAIITPQMIAQAQKKVEELGLTSSLNRIIASKTDLPIAELLFINKPELNTNPSLFDDLTKDANSKPKADNIKAIDIDVKDFLENVLPNAKTLEILDSARFNSNKLVLTKALEETSPLLFKWSNSFAWSYISGTTDAIKERVKHFGGDVEGYARISLSWHSGCDLDLSLEHVNTWSRIYYPHHQRKKFGWCLDVDMNGIDPKHDSENPIENIILKNRNDLVDGDYIVYVQMYSVDRTSPSKEFRLQFEIDGEIKTYHYPKHLQQGNRKEFLTFTVKDNTIKNIVAHNGIKLESENSFKNFIPIEAVSYSPNYWNNEQVGLKQLFFYTQEVNIDKPILPFFNEFIKDELHEHRKVLEQLAQRNTITPEPGSLTAFGFSISSKQNAIFRIKLRDNKQFIYNVMF